MLSSHTVSNKQTREHSEVSLVLSPELQNSLTSLVLNLYIGLEYDERSNYKFPYLIFKFLTINQPQYLYINFTLFNPAATPVLHLRSFCWFTSYELPHLAKNCKSLFLVPFTFLHFKNFLKNSRRKLRASLDSLHHCYILSHMAVRRLYHQRHLHLLFQ